jgi:hypothetical protein
MKASEVGIPMVLEATHASIAKLVVSLAFD